MMETFSLWTVGLMVAGLILIGFLAGSWFVRFVCRNERKNLDRLRRFGRLEVQDGDIVVVRYPSGLLSQDAYERLKQAVEKEVTPRWSNVKVVVLEEGMDIGVLRWKDSGDPREKPHIEKETKCQ